MINNFKFKYFINILTFGQQQTGKIFLNFQVFLIFNNLKLIQSMKNKIKIVPFT